MKKISIVIPARNEEETIVKVLDDIRETFSNFKYPYEAIVVDDHSVDKTAAVAREKGAIVIQNNGDSGKGNALKLGFKKAEGEYIVMMDADYSHRAEDMPLFIEQLERGAGLVIGSRILGGSEEYTRIRAFGNIFLTWMFGLLMGRYLSDALNGYKAFVRELVTQHNYTSNNFEIEIEIVANALKSGMRIVEVPSHERIRGGGEAKSKVVKDGFKFLSRIIIEKIKSEFSKNENKK